MSVYFSDGVTEADITDLLANLRDMDREELKALAGADPETAIRTSVLQSPGMCAVVRNQDDDILCIFGVANISILGSYGAPWLLGTDKLFDHSRDLLVHSRHILGIMTQNYAYLHNIVWDKNIRSIRYLKALGFTVGPRIRHPLTGAFFRPFYINREASDV